MDYRKGINRKLRFPLIWTIFFAIIGIFIQSIQTNKFIFFKFFISNYVSWFKSFGSFVNPTVYNSPRELLNKLLSHWYYFFYTGGLLSLLWSSLSVLLNREDNELEEEKEFD